MRRKLVETLERRRDGMIAALWANSGVEDKDRQKAIEQIEAQYDEAMEKVLLAGKHVPEEEIPEDNPFFKAAERGLAKLEEPRNDEGTMKQNIDVDIDQ